MWQRGHSSYFEGDRSMGDLNSPFLSFFTHPLLPGRKRISKPLSLCGVLHAHH